MVAHPLVKPFHTSWQENAELKKSMAAMKLQLDQLAKGATAHSTPPGRKRQPRSSEVAQSDDDDSADDEGPGSEGEGGVEQPPPEACLSQAAKLNRLRRLCERKPTGKCWVPDSIHEQYKKGGSERLALLDQLEANDWDKARLPNQ